MPKKPSPKLSPSETVIDVTPANITAVTAVTVTVTPEQIAIARNSAAALTTPISDDITTLVITDAVTFNHASAKLSDILAAKKKIESKVIASDGQPTGLMERIIRPIRTGLDQLYALQRQLLEPLEKAELLLKGKMADYQREQLRLLAIENENKRLEEQRLRIEADRLAREAYELARKADLERNVAQAKLQQERAQQLVAQAEASNRIADVVKFTPPVIAPAISTTSSSRVVTKWKLKPGKFDALIARVASGDAPSDILMLNASVLDTYCADVDYRSVMSDWAELEIYQDVTIAGRSK